MHRPKGVRSARVGERQCRAIGEAQDHVVLRIARPGCNELDDGAVKPLGRCKAHIRVTGDVRASRADAVHVGPRRAHARGATNGMRTEHRTAGDTDDADIDRPQRRRVAGNLHVAQRRTSETDGGDVGRRAAHLDHDRVGYVGVAQRARHRCGRSRIERAGGGLPEALQIGRSPVTAHHHHWGRDARSPHTLLDDVCSAHRNGQDRRIDRRSHGPELESVEPAQLRRRARREPAFRSQLGHARLVGRVIRRERLGHRNRTDTTGDEPVELRRDRGFVEAAGDVEERRHGLQRLSRCQLDATERRAPLGPLQLRHATEADHPDLTDVTFEQCVDGLRRRMGDEPDVRGTDLCGERGDATNHTVSHPVGGAVGRRHDLLTDDRAGRQVEGDGFGERPADIDADPNGSGRGWR